MLQISYSPRFLTTVLIDRRWSTDLYQVSYSRGNRFLSERELSHSNGCADLDQTVNTLRCANWRANPLPPAAEEYEAQAREQYIGAATVASLLRHPAGRAACRKAAEAGKSYSAEAEYYAPRRVVRQAVAKLSERLARREAAKAQSPRGANWFAEEAARRRVRRVKDAAAAAAAKGLYRCCRSRWAGGKNKLTIRIGSPACEGESYKEWSRNGKWSGHSSRKTITVPADWLDTVQAVGLAVCDDLLTLAAEPIQGHGPDLFRAAWVEQGRGVALNLVRGYIARLTHDGQTYTYHAPSARAALDGVQRKAKLKPARRQGTLDLDRLVRRHGDLAVRWGDHEGIACDSGTRRWCEAVGIDVGDGCTVADVVAGYRLRPHQEALQIVRRVVRDRHNRGPLDLSVPESGLEQQGRVVFDAEGGFRIVPPDSPN